MAPSPPFAGFAIAMLRQELSAPSAHLLQYGGAPLRERSSGTLDDVQLHLDRDSNRSWLGRKHLPHLPCQSLQSERFLQEGKTFFPFFRDSAADNGIVGMAGLDFHGNLFWQGTAGERMRLDFVSVAGKRTLSRAPCVSAIRQQKRTHEIYRDRQAGNSRSGESA